LWGKPFLPSSALVGTEAFLACMNWPGQQAILLRKHTRSIPPSAGCTWFQKQGEADRFEEKQGSLWEFGAEKSASCGEKCFIFSSSHAVGMPITTKVEIHAFRQKKYKETIGCYQSGECLR